MRAMLIKALAEFVRKEPDADRARVVRLLQDVDPEDLEIEARRRVRTSGGHSLSATVDALTALYDAAGARRAA